MTAYALQIDKEIYTNSDYLCVSRFLSYREQITSVMQLDGLHSLVEIGKGNGITSSVLKNFGYDVSTMDFDARLNPDVVGSILDKDTLGEKKYEAVLCFEVLEHLQFNDFGVALSNLRKLSSGYVLISLPYAGYGVRFQLYFSKYGERELNYVLRVPMFWKKHVFNGEHYWEPGKRSYSRSTVRKIISEYFDIEQEWLLPYNKSQIFYRCRVPD